MYMAMLIQMKEADVVKYSQSVETCKEAEWLR